MVWLLIALPLAAVVAGFATLWLAVKSDDGLVVDDYYRRGQEINLDLKRDRAAAARGLKAQMLFDSARREARIELNLPVKQLPAQLEMQLLHATRPGHDRQMLLGRAPDGSYRTALLGLSPGRYYVQLAAEDWRLLGSLNVPGDARIEILPVVRAQTP
jgi:hypothetical protein